MLDDKSIDAVEMATARMVPVRRNIGHKEDEPVPVGIDYDTWKWAKAVL